MHIPEACHSKTNNSNITVLVLTSKPPYNVLVRRFLGALVSVLGSWYNFNVVWANRLIRIK